MTDESHVQIGEKYTKILSYSMKIPRVERFVLEVQMKQSDDGTYWIRLLRKDPFHGDLRELGTQNIEL